MTKDQLNNSLKGSANIGGTFEFSTSKYEGMIFSVENEVFIWVDDIGFSKSPIDAEPRNVGEYKTIDEMLDNFKVDNEMFANTVLQDISELKQIYS